MASDYSTDSTNQIVKEFSKCHYNVHLVEVQEHKGKTHAQNEAVKQISTEFIVFTDANSIIRKNAIRELMASFTGDDIIYVSGKLEYVSNQINAVSKMESGYWKLDLWMRNAESNIYTITAGNGALYACRRSWYHFFEPIKCHDSAMPLFYGKLGKRAIYNADAIAYEKTGETAKDEYKRKTRMNREILKNMIPKLNLLRSFWFSIFYFGHRVCRYSLWWAHLVLLISNILLCFVEKTFFWNGLLVLQFICYIGAFLQYIKIVHFRISHWMFYYVMTILAQWHGVINIFTGRSKPIWEKAKSTR